MAKQPNLRNYRDYPGMVGWFDPPMLIDVARQAIVSALFGKYADGRLIQAALDPVDERKFAERADLTASLPKDKNGAIWIDYVADLGDGFDSTYAIAYLLGRPSLDVGVEEPLPRGQVLIMGGDQVYPAATADEYKRRMRRPYAHAFPDSRDPKADHPPVFLIPGNHDWYDGLTLFLALFCRSQPKKLGSWRAVQQRSYFALRFPGNWWIWGFDSQLGEDIDAPQADYFSAVARSMPEGAKIILCAPVPSWIHAELSATNPDERAKFFRGLDYIANIARNEGKKARICAVLSGDTHHYSRYSANEDGTQFIIAGGGGAFLHPTHQLADEITVSWMRGERHLLLKTEPGRDHNPTDKEACFPRREVSRHLLWGNLRFALINPLFCLTLGAIYWLMAQLLLLWRTDVLASPDPGFYRWAAQIAWAVLGSPAFLIVALTFVGALTGYADAKTKRTRLALGVAHAIPHVALLLALVSLMPPLNAAWFGALPGGDAFFLLFVVETLAAGFVGGAIWGAYLLAVCLRYGRHANDAFSAMRLDSYKHFLRLRIADDELTIYPIGLDKVPSRSDWQVNLNGGASQDEPIEYCLLKRDKSGA